MTVLFLSQIVPYPPHGGVLQRGYNLLRELGKHATVHLLAFVHPDELPTDAALEESRAAFLKFCKTVEFFPLWAKASPAHKMAALAASTVSSVPFSAIAHRSAALQRRVAELLESTPIDLIHADTLALDQFVDHRRSLPSVLTHHNIESILMRRRAEVETRLLPQMVLRREARKLAAFEAVASPRFDVNVVMSLNDAAALRELAPHARTAVVANGVDTTYFSPSSDEHTPAMIYTGGMNMFANKDAVLHFLHDMWPRIVDRVPTAKFFAIGQDPPTELRDFASHDQRVVVTGKVADIRPYVRQAAVYVVPLRVGGGTRLKVLDAMAMGKAIVSTSVGCEGLDVRDGEHLTMADTPEAFADATVALLGDRQRRLAIGRSARELVERQYSWSVIGGDLLSAYRDAIAHRKEKR